MKLEQLQYFVETARREHIGQAASLLYISPSAISHSIAALEEEFGKQLFIKQGRQIKLTTHGKMLFERAEFLLAEVDRIRQDLLSDQLKMTGHYEIAATHVLCAEFLTPSWMALQKDHPDLTATLYSVRSAEVFTRVDTSEIDLGFCFCPHSSPNHRQEVIYRGNLVLAFGKNHPFLKECDLAELNTYPAIKAKAAHGIENCENHPAMQKYNIQPKVVNLYDSYDVAIRALTSNTVWTLLPDIFAYKYRDKVETYIPDDWDAHYNITAIWPKYRIRTQVLDCIIEKMTDSIKKSTVKQKELA